MLVRARHSRGSSLPCFGISCFLLVAIPACIGESNEPLPDEQQGAEARSLEAATEPVQLDVEAERALAEQGDVDAQARLARAHYLGLGAAQDFQEAVGWARLAAEQGSGVGQGVLAAAYNTGSGVAQNFEEALRWSRLAAENGDATGQNVLGALYRAGQGVEQDFQEAVRLFRLGAEQGDHNSQALLGLMYMTGEGVQRDLVAAYMWMSLGASGPGISAPLDVLAGFMRPEQIEEAEARAREWGQ